MGCASCGQRYTARASKRSITARFSRKRLLARGKKVTDPVETKKEEAVDPSTGTPLDAIKGTEEAVIPTPAEDLTAVTPAEFEDKEGDVGEGSAAEEANE